MMPMNGNYAGPVPRPPHLDVYYSKGDSYQSFTETLVKERNGYTQKNIVIQSEAGEITIDYFFHDEPNDDLVFVFPVLGGRPMLSKYFAKYFAREGLDAAVVARVNDFKEKENFLHIEEVLRKGVVRDRIAIDFFEKEYGKKDFGTFGMSRGGINVAISAGVDERLQYNIIAMGGSGLIDVFEFSREHRIRRFIQEVQEEQGISREEFFEYMRANVITDPTRVAKHMDARDTLLMISTCDKTVPYRNGLQLRDEIGNPETIVLAAGHKTSVLFTQFLPVLPPWSEVCIFPFDYIETEATHFFNEKFERETFWTRLKLFPFRLLRLIPSTAVQVFDVLVGTDDEKEHKTNSKGEEEIAL
jgi:hypothetical protein